jgi:hypothetical protein
MFDIYDWNPLGAWIGWNLGQPPTTIQSQADLLITSLSGSSPVHLVDVDVRGWGEQGYIVAKGYEHLLLQEFSREKSSF